MRSGNVIDKSAIERGIRAAESGLLGLSHRIHAHPELAFEEVRASDWVTQHLSEAGFDVEHGCPTGRAAVSTPTTASASWTPPPRPCGG